MSTPESTVGERLARIETKLDAVLAQQTNHEVRVQANHTDHETRLRLLERKVWTAAGFAAGGGGAVGAIVMKVIGG